MSKQPNGNGNGNAIMLVMTIEQVQYLRDCVAFYPGQPVDDITGGHPGEGMLAMLESALAEPDAEHLFNV